MPFTLSRELLVVRWLAPPQLARVEERRSARSLWLASWPLLGVVSLGLGVAVAIEPATLTRRAITIGAVALLVTILHEVSRRGRPALASWVLVIGLTVIVTQRAWHTGGIHAPVSAFYVLFILLAGALLGARASRVTALVALVGALVLTISQSVGWLAPGTRSPLASFTFVVLAIGLALLVQRLVVPAKHRPEASAPHTDGMEAAPPLLSPLPISIRALVRTVVESATLRRRPSRTIEVRGDWASTCRCDADVLSRAFEGLVGNALDCAAEAGKVVVDVQTRAPIVRVTIRVEGGDSTRTAAQLAALDVAVCREAIEAHDGRLRVDAAHAMGPAYVVDLPSLAI